MALNLEAVGKKIGPFSRPYGWKDIILYALGVGAGVEDLGYLRLATLSGRESGSTSHRLADSKRATGFPKLHGIPAAHLPQT